MGLRRVLKNDLLFERVSLFRKAYPGVRMGLIGNVNESYPPICSCGGSDILVIWESPLRKVCLNCLSGVDLKRLVKA